MSTTTTNFKFILPELSDPADITQMNQNWETLDETLNDLDSIPVTSEVPEDSDIWIDPDEDTIEESHVTDMNNPHGVTTEQIGAISKTLVWENASPWSGFNSQSIYISGFSHYDAIEIVYSETTVPSVRVHSSGILPQPASEWLQSGASCEYILSTKDIEYDITMWRTVSFGAYNITVGDTMCFESGRENEGSSENIIPLQIYGIKGVK